MYIPYILSGFGMITKVFKSGNSLAVRIPKELTDLTEAGKEVIIEKVGETLVIRPFETKTLSELAGLFAQFTPGLMAEGRDFMEEPERDWDLLALPETQG